jgi:hypothetical protein
MRDELAAENTLPVHRKLCPIVQEGSHHCSHIESREARKEKRSVPMLVAYFILFKHFVLKHCVLESYPVCHNLCEVVLVPTNSRLD